MQMHLPTLSPKLRTGLVILHWLILAYVYGFFVLKATLQFSHPADLLAFYLPRALQSVGLTTYEYGEWAVHQANGYPLLPNFLQGLMVKLTGQINAVNAINVLGFTLSLIGIALLHGRRFPYRWFLTFCLSVPLFYYHITIGFIDLFAASMILLAFIGLHSLSVNHKPILAGILLLVGCTLAMASKMTVWPAAFVVGAAGIISLAYAEKHRMLTVPVRIILGIAIFVGLASYPLKNYLEYQNPTHPVQLRMYMKTLPAVAVVSEVEEMNIPESLKTSSQSMQFIYSLLEINRGAGTTPYRWEAFANHGRIFEHDQLGGFFFLTVVVLTVVLVLVFFLHPIHAFAFYTFTACVIVVANLPHSGVLRYSLFLPLIGFFLICADFHLLRRQIRRLAVTGFTLCTLFVLSNLGNTFWFIDPRPHDAYAPTAARQFWQDNGNKPFTATLLIEGAYPSTIYWAGPDFNTWHVREVLENRYVNTIRPVVPK